MDNDIKNFEEYLFEKNNQVDKIDVIKMDVPLFIRMLEYAKEDAKTDMDLHSATENILKLLEKSDVLDMDNYNDIINVKKDKK